MRRPFSGVGLGLGGLLGALVLLHPLLLALAPLLFLWQGVPALLGFALVLGRGLLLPLPEPPYGVRVEGVFTVREGFTQWEGHRLRLKHFPPLADGVYRLKGYLAPRSPGAILGDWTRGPGSWPRGCAGCFTWNRRRPWPPYPILGHPGESASPRASPPRSGKWWRAWS